MAFKVADKYRTSFLSLRPGGYTVVVELNTGEIREYDKVKNPEAYIRVLSNKSNIKNAWVKGS